MDDTIITKKVSRKIAKVNDFILCEEPMSRLVFQPEIHLEGVRGKIIRQRRESKDDSWVPDKAIHIRSLGKNESINIEISTKGIESFYSAIVKLKQIVKEHGIEVGKNEYRISDLDSIVINNNNKAIYIKKLIEAGYSEEMWNNLAEENPTLVEKMFYAKMQIEKKKIVDELDSRLQSDEFLETSGNNSWQKWIYKHNWLFGVNYQKPIEQVKINLMGIMPDYLFPTVDGFVDILEIKLPNDEVLIKDKSHAGSYKWTKTTNTAIGQVVNYLGEIDGFKSAIENNVKINYKYDVSLLKPRAYILIGNSGSWDNEKKEALRKMNNALHGIEVLTYKDLVDRGNQAVNINLL